MAEQFFVSSALKITWITPSPMIKFRPNSHVDEVASSQSKDALEGDDERVAILNG